MIERPNLKPTTQRNPLLRALFIEQERRGWTNKRLAKLAGCSPSVLSWLRHPAASGSGKAPRIATVAAIANALGYELVLIKKEARE